MLEIIRDNAEAIGKLKVINNMLEHLRDMLKTTESPTARIVIQGLQDRLMAEGKKVVDNTHEMQECDPRDFEG